MGDEQPRYDRENVICRVCGGEYPRLGIHECHDILANHGLDLSGFTWSAALSEANDKRGSYTRLSVRGENASMPLYADSWIRCKSDNPLELDSGRSDLDDSLTECVRQMLQRLDREFKLRSGKWVIHNPNDLVMKQVI